jgi:hypothetical protein
MRATTEWLAVARGWVAVAVLAAALAGALVAATLIPGSLGGTSTGSASLLPERSASWRAPEPVPVHRAQSAPRSLRTSPKGGGSGVTTTSTPTVRSSLTDAVPRER